MINQTIILFHPSLQRFLTSLFPSLKHRNNRTIRVQIQWMAEEDLRRDRRDPAPPETQAVRTRPFFSPRKLEKVYLSQFRHKRRRPITFSSRNVSTRIFDPPPSNLFAPSRNLPIPLSPPLFFPFFFQRSSRRMDSRFETTTRSIFKAGSISREPPRFLSAEEDANDFKMREFLPSSRMDGS